MDRSKKNRDKNKKKARKEIIQSKKE